MIHVLTSKYELSEYIFSDLEGIDTILVPVKKHNALRHRLVKAIYYKMCPLVYSNYYPKNISDRLKDIQPDDTLIVIGEDSYDYWLLSHLCSKVKYKVAFFWNSCVSIKSQKCNREISKNKDKVTAIINYIKRIGFVVATFDLLDAKKYDMAYYPQFYRSYPSKNSHSEIKYDFFFCGRNKGRIDIIDYFKTRLSKFGICKFIVIPEKSPDAMNYFDYLSYVKMGGVVCEISQKGQSGLTIRALEAMFLKKKLITNNALIKQMDFYKPSNILILTKNTSDESIRNFLSIPYEDVSDDVLEKYDVRNFLKFLNETAHSNYSK